MDFEMNDLEIIDANKFAPSTQTSSATTPASHQNNSNSMIVNELHKEIEETQNKLKLNYKRMLLFETENNKLIEEKNKLFFEINNINEKNKLLVQKIQELENHNTFIEKNHKLLAEKVSVYENVNRTQLAEIKRFSKFHDKIQTIVKPFILKLKNQITSLQSDLSESQRINNHMSQTYKDFCKKIELELNQKDNEIAILHAEKNGLVRTYEEQIHSFSKEIIELQSKNESSSKEISRLKKSVEFKNYFENEVIRFKRTHEEDQKIISEITQKKSSAETKCLELEQQLSEAKSESMQIKNRIADIESTLEVTRSQFSKKIDELNIMTERFSRLERLNNQLSLELSSKRS